MNDGSLLSFEREQVVNHIGIVPTESWDADKVYRVPVILFSFADCDFSWDDPKLYYDRMFNASGYNLGKGPGCVADYFRDQSRGLFNIQFDIIGPVKLSSKQKADKSNPGTSQFLEALRAIDSQVNFKEYDWDNKGTVPTVLFIYAGYGGNETAEVASGCIYPNTGQIYTKLDDVIVKYYSASAELWSNNVSCGIGTICHEYCHTMGLPDLYPTDDNSPEFSVLDEWDLMDGGCFSDDGWCPPNLSAHERELLNWQTPVDLTSPTHITDMPSFNSSGLAYRIVNDAYPSEFYLLENRQQEGWDRMLPGHGLLVSHVDYDDNSWSWSEVNNDPAHHRFDYFHADNLDFNYYERLYGRANTYTAEGRSIRLQHTAYPYTDGEGVSYDALTDSTTPAASLFHARRDGSRLMGKPITQIQETDGLISFHFCDSPEAITPARSDATPIAIYDLQGHLVKTPSSGIYIVRYADGTTKKCIR